MMQLSPAHREGSSPESPRVRPGLRMHHNQEQLLICFSKDRLNHLEAQKEIGELDPTAEKGALWRLTLINLIRRLIEQLVGIQ